MSRFSVIETCSMNIFGGMGRIIRIWRICGAWCWVTYWLKHLYICKFVLYELLERIVCIINSFASTQTVKPVIILCISHQELSPRPNTTSPVSVCMNCVCPKTKLKMRFQPWGTDPALEPDQKCESVSRTESLNNKTERRFVYRKWVLKPYKYQSLHQSSGTEFYNHRPKSVSVFRKWVAEVAARLDEELIVLSWRVRQERLQQGELFTTSN